MGVFAQTNPFTGFREKDFKTAVTLLTGETTIPCDLCWMVDDPDSTWGCKTCAVGPYASLTASQQAAIANADVPAGALTPPLTAAVET
jgi:hypothetical protein